VIKVRRKRRTDLKLSTSSDRDGARFRGLLAGFRRPSALVVIAFLSLKLVEAGVVDAFPPLLSVVAA